MGEEFEEALRSAQESQKTFSEIRDQKGEASAHLIAAEIHMALGSFDDALQASGSALQLCRSSCYAKGESAALERQAMIYLRQDDP